MENKKKLCKNNKDMVTVCGERRLCGFESGKEAEMIDGLCGE